MKVSLTAFPGPNSISAVPLILTLAVVSPVVDAKNPGLPEATVDVTLAALISPTPVRCLLLNAIEVPELVIVPVNKVPTLNWPLALPPVDVDNCN